MPEDTPPRLQPPQLLASNVVTEPEPPDPRHVIVAVRTVPVVAEPSQVHTYRDAGGLSWQTYGQERDFSADRMLEIVNGQDEVVATYAPGTWLDVRYEQYADNTAVTP